jgi:metal-sulfur cluster biosynthetic enzyme
MSEETKETDVLEHDLVMTAIRQVIDPELHYNIVDLGLIYEVRPKAEKVVEIDMTLTSPGCPFGPMLIHQVKEVVGELGASEVNLEIVWEPPWGLDKMTDEAKIDLGIDL